MAKTSRKPEGGIGVKGGTGHPIRTLTSGNPSDGVCPCGNDFRADTKRRLEGMIVALQVDPELGRRLSSGDDEGFFRALK